MKPMKPYRIDKRVRLPEPSRGVSDGKASRASVTMRLLEVGDSFLVKELDEMVSAQKGMRDRNRRERAGQKPRVFAARKVAGGLRIWRVA